MNVQQMETAKAKTPQAPPVNSGVWTGLLIVGFVSIASLIFTALVGWAWLKHDNAAAWLQAIGAIVGIGIAVAVPAWQHRTTVRREAERERLACRRLLEITLELSRNSLDMIILARTPHSSIINGELADNFRREISRAAKSLSDDLGGVPLQAFPSAQAASAVLGMRSHLGLLIKMMSEPPTQHIAGVAVPWYHPMGLVMLSNLAHQHCKVLESALAQYQ